MLTLEAATRTTKHDMRGDIMAKNRNQDYFDDNNEGHVDTREANFQCENRDEHLGFDPGIDVAG
jgi:hypothetical protein